MLHIIQTLLAWRRFIFWSGFFSAVAMGVVAFLLPKWYLAGCSVFPPDPNQFGSSSYLQMLQSLQMPMLGPNATGLTPQTIYVDVLQSRRIGEAVIEEFGYKKLYKKSIMAEAIEALHEHTFYSVLENGLLKIGFEDKDPERAAAVTNRYIALLDEFVQELNITKAGKTKEFFAAQMEVHARDLRDAEESLRQYQEDNKALQLDAQVSKAIEVMSTLSADAIALEVDLELLRQYASQNSQEYIRKKKRYDEVIRQLQKFENASNRDKEDVVRGFFPTFDTVPETKLEMARRMRRVMVEEKVHALLIEEFERLSIEEARDIPTVQVLDRASVPEMKNRPKRAIIAAAGGVAGIVWASLIALFVSVWREEGERSQALRSVVQPVLSDLKNPFRRRRGK